MQLSGRADLTVGYLRYDTPASPEPQWSMAELRDNATVDFTLALPLESQSPTCPRLAPTAAGGYVLAWQDAVGSRIGVYNTSSNRFYPRLFVTAVQFGGADVQPPLVGVGEVSRDYTVVFSRARFSVTSVRRWASRTAASAADPGRSRASTVAARSSDSVRARSPAANDCCVAV